MWFKSRQVKDLEQQLSSLRNAFNRVQIDHSESMWSMQRKLRMITDACDLEYFEEEPKSGYRKKQAVQ